MQMLKLTADYKDQRDGVTHVEWGGGLRMKTVVDTYPNMKMSLFAHLRTIKTSIRTKNAGVCQELICRGYSIVTDLLLISLTSLLCVFVLATSSHCLNYVYQVCSLYSAKYSFQ